MGTCADCYYGKTQTFWTGSGAGGQRMNSYSGLACCHSAPTPRRDLHGDNANPAVAFWPEVKPTAWCGAWTVSTGPTIGSVAVLKGDQGDPGSANNVQFTGSVTLGVLLAIGNFNRDITVTGILATDKITVMPATEIPDGFLLVNARPLSANTVRLQFRALS